MRKISEEITLKDVVERLDRLIILLKLFNKEAMQKIKQEIMSDPVKVKILELADGTREYTTLAREVAQATGKSERWVKERISQLVDIYAIVKKRVGGKVYYENSGLYD